MKEKPFIVFVSDTENEEIKVYTEDLRKILNEAEINKDVEEVSINVETATRTTTLNMKLSDIRKLIKKSELQESIVPKWISQYLRDLTHTFSKKNFVGIKGRDNELKKIWFYLSQKKRNNVFLIGPPDVGKTNTALEVIRRISTNECPREFYDTRVLELKVNELNKIKSAFIYANVIDAIIDFLIMHKKNIIVYIDKAISMRTELNLSLMLYKIIGNHIRLITTEYESNFANYFLRDMAISKYINYVKIEEPELDEIGTMLEGHIRKLKKQYRIKISDKMINFAVFTSVLSNSSSSNPGKAINVLERAFLEAKRNDKDEVDKVSILSCYDTYLKLYESLTIDEKRATAYHEAGHYIASIKSKYLQDLKIAFVSILPMMWFMGVNWFYEKTSEATVTSSEYFMDSIVCDLAGRVGEMKVTYKATSGACSDLEHANAVAEAMIMQFGLSIKGNENNRYFDDYGMLSEERKRVIDNEIQAIIDAANQKAKKIIEDNAELHRIIAERLLKDEILTGEQLEKICQEFEES